MPSLAEDGDEDLSEIKDKTGNASERLDYRNSDQKKSALHKEVPLPQYRESELQMESIHTDRNNMRIALKKDKNKTTDAILGETDAHVLPKKTSSNGHIKESAPASLWQDSGSSLYVNMAYENRLPFFESGPKVKDKIKQTQNAEMRTESNVCVNSEKSKGKGKHRHGFYDNDSDTSYLNADQRKARTVSEYINMDGNNSIDDEYVEMRPFHWTVEMSAKNATTTTGLNLSKGDWIEIKEPRYGNIHNSFQKACAMKDTDRRHSLYKHNLSAKLRVSQQLQIGHLSMAGDINLATSPPLLSSTTNQTKSPSDYMNLDEYPRYCEKLRVSQQLQIGHLSMAGDINQATSPPLLSSTTNQTKSPSDYMNLDEHPRYCEKLRVSQQLQIDRLSMVDDSHHATSPPLLSSTTNQTKSPSDYMNLDNRPLGLSSPFLQSNDVTNHQPHYQLSYQSPIDMRGGQDKKSNGQGRRAHSTSRFSLWSVQERLTEDLQNITDASSSQQHKSSIEFQSLLHCGSRRVQSVSLSRSLKLRNYKSGSFICPEESREPRYISHQSPPHAPGEVPHVFKAPADCEVGTLPKKRECGKTFSYLCDPPSGVTARQVSLLGPTSTASTSRTLPSSLYSSQSLKGESKSA